MYIFNLFKQLNKKIKALNEEKQLSMEIIKAWTKFVYDDFDDKVFSNKHEVKNTINGKEVKIYATCWGYSPSDEEDDGCIACLYDNGLIIKIIFSHNGWWFTFSPTQNSKFKYCYGSYKNVPNCALSFEEYKPYLKDLLNFLNSKYDEFKKEKDDEFQKFRQSL